MTDYKKDFPLLKDSQVAYLDNAATAQRPLAVLEAEKDFYEKYNANPLRGLYELGMEATDRYEEARDTVRDFLHAKKSCEIIFTRNTTESINLVAYSYGLNNLKAGDELLVGIDSHHSNLLPWQMVARQTGASLKFLECEMDGHFTEEAIENAITEKTKLAAITHVSNVIGRVNPVEKIIEKVHGVGGVVLVDAAQSAPHIPIDVQAMDVDFLAFSGHKLMAPMGIGVLYGKEGLLDAMPPFLTGGEMIESVTREGAVFAELPHKFEAGTVNGGGAWGLKAAIDYLNSIGFAAIEEKENALTALAMEELKKIPHVHVIGSEKPEEHNGILNFTIDGVHPHDIASILDGAHVDVRAGHHCAQPLLAHLSVMVTTRASISFYNTEEDVLRLTEQVKKIRRLMGYDE
ncbi:aminotransferase class V-fold PLP-dependent enzyme [Blautia sp. Sow4_E7]|uniref:aminotransferase class V-fold PLP-dependent enzyme n=1 Tax=Blautia sp. Sow4_E7 TaxID=3438749 RepID=UPI003F900BFE